jgi:soluble lytic murein transglycosylase
VRVEFPLSQVRDDATWRLAWLYYRSGELTEAYRTFKLLASEARESALRTAAHYWQGRAAEKAGDSEIAKRIYEEVYGTGEESYYQALAAGSLAKLGAPVQERNFDPPGRGRDLEPPAIPRIAFHLERARALSALALRSLAVAEIGAIERLAGTDKEARLFLSREYFKNHAYRKSLALATQLPAWDGERDFYRFPLAHWEVIRQKAQEREMDPYLILALIRQESLFDARARSPAVALGLMQLLPSTAARVAGRIGMPAPSNEKLFDPEINLTLGTQYLKDLLQRYSNNWFKAIAAYNAGEAAVDRWEKEIITDDIEEFVERIPYLETRGYVKLVMRNHRIYKRLYGHEK